VVLRVASQEDESRGVDGHANEGHEVALDVLRRRVSLG
jgi:hypothetical protein